MDVTSKQTLEFERIRSQVASLCLTEEARSRLALESIWTETAPLADHIARVKPFLDLLVRVGDIPTSDFPPILEILEKTAPEGCFLDGTELKAIARYVESAARWRAFLQSRTETALQNWAQRIDDLSLVAQRLNRVLDFEGNILEDAVPELVKIKSEIARSRTEIDQTAKSFLRDTQTHDVWQSSNPTQKDGRTVLPLKSNFKGKIPALVHESSASGQTLYVEPFELVEKNNRLVEAHNAWKAEVYRILKELSQFVREHRDALLRLVETTTNFDLLLCRARWGYVNRGAFAQLTRPGQPWKLVQARHPLLGQAAVPIDVDVPAGIRVLLISGPNTGGKTVTLKTVGLLSALHQFALPIPASDESILPVWDGIYTEVGDHQSLDEALSTFSSHMKRMADIVQVAGERSLVLLDEIGSGTDPLEGGALGMSFLEHFLARRINVLGTTHHGALKNYSFTHSGARNASVEFDTDRHRPTYRILPDVPGSSHALETAIRMGIPVDLVERARKHIEGEESDVASVIRALREKQFELSEREKDVREKETTFRETLRKTDLLQLRLKQRETELKSQGLGEANRFLSESRKAFEAMVKEIREGELTTEKIKQMRAFFQSTQDAIEAQKNELEREELERIAADVRLQRELETGSVPAASEYRVGQDVFVEPGGQRGSIVRKAGKDQYQVAIGAIKMTVKAVQIRPAQPKTTGKVEVYTSEVDASERPVFSLDLRGFRLEDALQAVEKQIDRALIKGLHEFSIVHGLGEGVLQKGIQEYLRNRREIQKFFFSNPQEGGFGKTIVQL